MAIRISISLAALFLVALAGCGMPGAPQPPSLNLPVRVDNLTAVRTADSVALTWTMPTRTTDKVTLKLLIAVRICRSESNSDHCDTVATLQLQPGAASTYTDTLPQVLSSGPARALNYSVELINRKGRSAGLSNLAVVLAGAAPPPVDALTAELRKSGVLLHWTPQPAGTAPAAIRLQRKLLTPPRKQSDSGSLAPPAEPLDRTLIVDPGPPGNRALDSDIRFSQIYEYRAQRVVRITINNQTLELASAPSAPVRIEAADVFPPATPTGLAAVATTGDSGNNPAVGAPAIDLSWNPVPDPSVAGYVVYRHDLVENTTADAPWQRISPAEPVTGPGFRDNHVQPGRSYAYSVSAIGQNGHESAHSTQTQETVPGP